MPNTASLADGRKFLRASSHDLVVVREIAGAERAGIDGKLLELLADVSELVLISDVDESSGPRRLIDMMSYSTHHVKYLRNSHPWSHL